MTTLCRPQSTESGDDPTSKRCADSDRRPDRLGHAWQEIRRGKAQLTSTLWGLAFQALACGLTVWIACKEIPVRYEQLTPDSLLTTLATLGAIGLIGYLAFEVVKKVLKFVHATRDLLRGCNPEVTTDPDRKPF